MTSDSDRGEPPPTPTAPETGPPPTPESCDVCGSLDVSWRSCKLICRNCRAIVKSCADL